MLESGFEAVSAFAEQFFDSVDYEYAGGYEIEIQSPDSAISQMVRYDGYTLEEAEVQYARYLMGTIDSKLSELPSRSALAYDLVDLKRDIVHDLKDGYVDGNLNDYYTKAQRLVNTRHWRA